MTELAIIERNEGERENRCTPARMLLTTLLLAGSICAYDTSAWAASCDPGRVELQVLGSGGPELDDSRASASYLLWLDGRAAVLVDFGGGASLNFERTGADIADLQAVLLTHLHVDHSAALAALAKAAYFTDRRTVLPVYGPAGNALMPATSEFLYALLGPDGAYPYLQDYLADNEPGQFSLRPIDVPLSRDTEFTAAISEGLTITAIAVHHGPVAAIAWRIDAFGCAVAFSGDTSNRYGTLARLARGVDLLVAHNAVPEGASGIARELHMPPSEIGKIAAAAQVEAVLLSHRMRRTLGKEQQTTQAIAAHYRGDVRLADDLDRLALPLVSKFGHGTHGGRY